MRRILLLVFLLGQTACGSTGYLWHVSMGQLDILLSRRPLADAIADARLPEEERRQLALVPVVKAFGVEQLGLGGGHTYDTFVQLDRPYATLVLSAAPPDSLDPYRWRFPIVGSVPYKGFFSEHRAARERDALAAEGFDVFLRPASAFSTLGWFEDPILSSMLGMSDADLIETVLHEMTHATLYFPDHTNFNETAATFVGHKGAVAFLAAQFGPGSASVRQAEGDAEDEQRFSRFIGEVLDGLREIYARPVSREEKLRAKAEWLAAEKNRFRRELARFNRPGRYARFIEGEWNNASLLARSAYYGDLAYFDRLFRKRGEPLRDFVRYLKTWSEGDPRERLVREAGAVDLAARPESEQP